MAAAIAPRSGEPEKDEVAVAFSDRLKVQRIRTTTLIEIKFSSADPVKAARVANAIAEDVDAEDHQGDAQAGPDGQPGLDVQELQARIGPVERRQSCEARHRDSVATALDENGIGQTYQRSKKLAIDVDAGSRTADRQNTALSTHAPPRRTRE